MHGTHATNQVQGLIGQLILYKLHLMLLNCLWEFRQHKAFLSRAGSIERRLLLLLLDQRGQPSNAFFYVF